MKILVVIPTRNRPNELKNTLNYLNKNKDFFSRIIVVDASDIQPKKKIKRLLLNYNLDIELIDAQASTCTQRNLGFTLIKDEKFIMFLDDDNIFYQNAFKKMYEFLKSKNELAGVAFNQILNEKLNFLDKLKRNLLIDKLNIYPNKLGGFSKSGWQSRFLNFKKNTYVEWLPTRAVVYSVKLSKNLRFDTNLGVYGYLEDLDFSLQLKKLGKIMVCSEAKYTHDQTISRPGYDFGKKEVKNRYYLVKKHNLSKILFFFTLSLKILLNFKEGIKGNKNSLKRFYGNMNALFNINKIDK